MSHSNSKQIVLDTETTGLNPEEGHRVIEIGCVELINRRLTKNNFHVYLNPDRHIDEGAIEVHGISNEFLLDKPHFEDVVEEFLAFIQDAELIIHNAPFDVGFLNHELALLNKSGKVEDYSQIFDTLVFARTKHPGQRNSLDALCKRYGIDNSHRELHGALLDAEILADVYLLMTGGQFSLLDNIETVQDTDGLVEIKRITKDRAQLKVVTSSLEEIEAHQHLLEVVEKANGKCIWKV